MPKKSEPLVSIIIPTKNSEGNMLDFLNSLTRSTYKNIEVIVNDDIRSSDNLQKLCQSSRFSGLSVNYMQENTSMAQGRRTGSLKASGEILIHLDSDMQVTKGLIKECVENLKDGYDTLIIPEVSIGYSFWARVKALEKRMYQGVRNLESVRVMKKVVYDDVEGHNPEMVFSEDKDLDIRIQDKGFSTGRTTSLLFHNEGEIRFMHSLKKKLSYSNTANLFRSEHPAHYAWQANPFNRYLIFIKQAHLLLRHPLLYPSAFVLKTGEYLFSFFGVIRKRTLS